MYVGEVACFDRITPYEYITALLRIITKYELTY